MTHPTWNLEVSSNGASLVLTPCPGTKDETLLASLQQLKEQGVQAVVTALETEEMEKAGVAQLPSLTKELGMAWFSQPVEDDCAPDEHFAKQWLETSPQVQKILEQGGKVALHCMGGSGRTGLLAAHILLELDWELDDIISKVKALRPGAFSKPVQIDYIEQFRK